MKPHYIVRLRWRLVPGVVLFYCVCPVCKYAVAEHWPCRCGKDGP